MADRSATYRKLFRSKEIGWFETRNRCTVIFVFGGKEKRGYLCDDVFLDGPYTGLYRQCRYSTVTACLAISRQTDDGLHPRTQPGGRTQGSVSSSLIFLSRSYSINDLGGAAVRICDGGLPTFVRFSQRCSRARVSKIDRSRMSSG
jgi:hypothetical protein